MGESPGELSTLDRMESFATFNNNQQKFESTLFAEEEYEDLPPVDADKRKCTDFIFFFLLLITWAGMLAIGAYGFENGDPYLLIYGSDNKGRLCGGETLPDQRYLAYPRLSLDVADAVLQNPSDPTASLGLFGVCVESCPKEGDYVCTLEAEEVLKSLTASTGDSRETLIRDCENSFFGFLGSCQDSILRDECFETIFNNTGYLFRCFPEYVYQVNVDEAASGCTKFKNYTNIFGQVETRCERFKKVSEVIEEEPAQANLVFDTFNTFARIVSFYISDIYIAYDVILVVGIAVSTVTGFLYILGLFLCVGFVIWGSVVLSFLALCLLTIYCYFKGGTIPSEITDKIFSGLTDGLSDAQQIYDNILNNDNGENDIVNNCTQLINSTLVNGTLVNTTLVDCSNATTTDEDGIVNLGGASFVPEFITASADYSQTYENMAYALTAFCIVYLLLIIILGPRIAKAVEIFEEASMAIKANPSLLIIPPFALAILVANIVYYIAAAAHITGTGDLVIDEFPGVNETVSLSTSLASSEYVGEIQYIDLVNVFLLFGFLWTRSFFNGIFVMSASGVVCAWYWAGGNGPSEYQIFKGVPAVFRSFYVTIRFHLGSIAFGSLLIAIVELIRIIAAFISHRVQKIKQDSKIIKFMLLSINCFLRCAEKCVKFVSRNSFIMTAMYGGNFCRSSQMAFFAIAHNLGQIATVNFLGDLILRFGQMLVSVMCAVICWLWLENSPEYGFGGEKELSSKIPPVLVCALIAAMFAREVLGIYDVAVDTILLTYCQDKKRLELRGTGGKIHANTSMQNLMAKQPRKSIPTDRPSSSNKNRNIFKPPV